MSFKVSAILSFTPCRTPFFLLVWTLFYLKRLHRKSGRLERWIMKIVVNKESYYRIKAGATVRQSSPRNRIAAVITGAYVHLICEVQRAPLPFSRERKEFAKIPVVYVRFQRRSSHKRGTSVLEAAHVADAFEENRSKLRRSSTFFK